MKDKNLLEYKGYFGSVKFCREKKCFYGRIKFIEDLVTFDAATRSKLEREFHFAVDDYISTCKQVNKKQNKSAKK